MLSVLSRLFKPQQLAMGVYYAKDDERLMVEFDKPLPRVILMTDKLLRQWDPEAPTLEELGYEEYDRDATFRGTYFALRPWVWPLKAWLWVERAWFRAVYWSYGRLWYLDPWAMGNGFKLSRLRPGSGAVSRARKEAADMRARITAQGLKIDELKRDKESQFRKGMQEGWKQYSDRMEDLLEGPGGDNDE